MRTTNPALQERRFANVAVAAGQPAMTLQGTATRSLLLVLLATFAASYTWHEVATGNVGIIMPALLVGGLGGLVIAMVTVFKPTMSPWSAPLYAVLEGLVLGAMSAYYNARFDGLPMQAVGLTFGVFLALLVLYRTRVLQATDRFRTGVVAATAAIAILYLLSFVLRMFGVSMPYLHDSSALSIGISLVIVGVAALNLILDFDLIERGVALRAPKYMEWYAAFGLLVTLVWLYLEMLRLLSKIQGRGRN